MLKFVCLLTFVSAALALDEISFKTTSSKRYHVSDITLTYAQANAICKRFGWSLATEKSADDTARINAAIQEVGAGTYYHFLGGYRQIGGDFYPQWIWLDSGEEFDYSNWNGGTVSTSYECLVKYPISNYAGTWTSTSCTNTYRFVCESFIEV